MTKVSNLSAYLGVIALLSSCEFGSNGTDCKVKQKLDTQKVVKDFTVQVAEFDTLSYVDSIERYIKDTDKKILDFSSFKVDVFGESSQGGEINIYYNRSDTIKWKALYYGETGKSEYSLYFFKKQIVAFKETAFYYKELIGKRPAKIDSTVSETYLLYNRGVVAGKKGNVSVDKDCYEQKSSNINDIYSEIRNQLNQ